MLFRKKTPPAYSANEVAFPPIGTSLPPGGLLSMQPPRATQPAVPGQRSKKRFIKRGLVLILILIVLSGGYVGVKALVNASKSLHGNLFGLLQSQKLKGEDTGRVSVLLAGNSADDSGHSGAELTDSIMLISVDTVRHTAFMLSIPRDLYVAIPGHGYSKINAAYEYGKADKFSEPGYAPGGMGLLEKVVSKDLGIAINYYGLINYAAFRDAVNAVGGVDVTITSSDSRGLYDANIAKVDGGPLKLANGLQHLDGQTALNLARARGDSYYAYGFPRSDFDRTAHQRQLLLALKAKVGSASVLSNPVKLGNVLDSFGNNVETDFKTSEVRRVYDIVQKIPDGSITSIGLNDVGGKNLLASYTTRDRQSALIPAAGLENYTTIQTYIKTLTTPPPADNSSAN